jgi:hypothetical protein
MPFKFDHQRRFTRPCKSADGQTFEVEFKALSDEQVKEHDFASLEGEKDFLRDVILNIPDVRDPADKPMTFDAGLLDQMLGYADLRGAFLRGYREGVTGARLGN